MPKAMQSQLGVCLKGAVLLPLCASWEWYLVPKISVKAISLVMTLAVVNGIPEMQQYPFFMPLSCSEQGFVRYYRT